MRFEDASRSYGEALSLLAQQEGFRQALIALGLGGSMASAGADWLADLTASAGAVAQAKVVRPTKAQRAEAVQQGILSPGDVDRMEGGALRDMLDAAGALGVTVTLRFPSP